MLLFWILLEPLPDPDPTLSLTLNSSHQVCYQEGFGEAYLRRAVRFLIKVACSSSKTIMAFTHSQKSQTSATFLVWKTCFSPEGWIHAQTHCENSRGGRTPKTQS